MRWKRGKKGLKRRYRNEGIKIEIKDEWRKWKYGNSIVRKRRGRDKKNIGWDCRKDWRKYRKVKNIGCWKKCSFRRRRFWERSDNRRRKYWGNRKNVDFRENEKEKENRNNKRSKKDIKEYWKEGIIRKGI